MGGMQGDLSAFIDTRAVVDPQMLAEVSSTRKTEH